MIHQFQKDGYNVIVDNNSGNIHCVDDVVYEIIKIYKDTFIQMSQGNLHILDDDILTNFENLENTCKKLNISFYEFRDILEEINSLIKDEVLFSKDNFQENAMEFKDKLSILKAICLHVAHDCNMDCQYCFAGKGEYKGEKSLMSLETAKASIDFLIKNSGNRRNLEVDFFGGEPLLNWDVCKETVKYAKSIEKKYNKNFRFTLTTNGILIDDEVIDFSNKYMCNVVLSLDGRKSINDNMRKTKNGQGTYDLVIEKFKKLADLRNHKDYYVRGTYTKENLDFAKDIIHVADLGFKELSMEPVVTSDDMYYAISTDDIPKIMENYDILSKEMEKRQGKDNEFNFYHYDVDFTKGPCVAKRISGCGVGTEYLAITPEGDIYPCHQFVGDDEYLLGNLDIGVLDENKIGEFKNCNIYSRQNCIDCFAKLYCSGGCSANAYHQKGNILETYDLSCELHKKRVENSIIMEVKRQFE